MKTILLVLSLCAAVVVTPANAADREWVDYNRLLEITRLDKFNSAPPAQRDKVRVFGTMTPKNKAIAPSDIVFTVVHNGERKRIAIGSDGKFDPAIDPAWIKANPKVLTNMPEGEKAGFSFGVSPVVPAGVQFDYAALMASVQQGNALMKSQGGMMRFMLPTFVGIGLHYPRGQAASVRIQSRLGDKTFSADANGVLNLALDESLLAANAHVTLSQRPQSFDMIAE